MPDGTKRRLRAPIRDSAVTCSIGSSRRRPFPLSLSSCSPQFRALSFQSAFPIIPSSRSVISLRKARVSIAGAIVRHSTQQLDALSLTRAVYPARLMESCALCCVGSAMACDTSCRPVPPAPSRASTPATSFSRVTYACSTSHTHVCYSRALLQSRLVHSLQDSASMLWLSACSFVGQPPAHHDTLHLTP